MSEQIVTVDIGGTHARFAIAEVESGRVLSLGEATTLHTKDHASFQTAWQDFERQQGGTLPRAVAIAIAGLWALHQQYFNQFQAIGST